MSRATYIWIVQDADGVVVAAFTVKHELASWLSVTEGVHRVSRIRDGRWHSGVQLNPQTLERAK